MIIAISPLISFFKTYKRYQTEQKRLAQTKHSLNSLPEYLLRDIGWPERYLKECSKEDQ